MTMAYVFDADPMEFLDDDEDPGAGQPGSATWDVLHWEDDPWAQYFVAMHREGATHQEIGAEIGITPGRVWQIEVNALQKIRHAGIDLRSLLRGADNDQWDWRGRGRSAG
jgi:Sigma-70, region 4